MCVDTGYLGLDARTSRHIVSKHFKSRQVGQWGRSVGERAWQEPDDLSLSLPTLAEAEGEN